MGKKRLRINRRQEKSMVHGLDCCQRFTVTMLAHFPQVEPNDVLALSCDGCMDKRAGICEGRGLVADQVMMCMQAHTEGGFAMITPDLFH